MAEECIIGNTLPIDLDKRKLVNVSEQLTKFKYDFINCKSFKIKKK